MPRVLGIDTSNYTTSVAVVEDGSIVYDKRKLLEVKLGERGLRQSEALFQHVINLPSLMENMNWKGFDAVCVSTRPRPVEGSYMPVFRAGESTGRCIASSLGVPFIETTHQEGHIEAALQSVAFKFGKFKVLHMSGGTTELLDVRTTGKGYEVEIIGGTRDISLGQFLDRTGVAMGLPFPAGRAVDEQALRAEDKGLRIPSRVDGLYFNLSGQETKGLKYIQDGYNHEEIALAVMLCAAKTLEKVFVNLFNKTIEPVLLIGGVASSRFIRQYIEEKFKGSVFFSEGNYASDNAVGAAFIGYNHLTGGQNDGEHS